jgi:hypothetical protein
MDSHLKLAEAPIRKLAWSSIGSPLTYIATVAVSGAACAALYIGCLMALQHTGHLPPPPFVNSLCADGKLKFWRESPPENPTHLIVGSSVAWEDLDSERIVEADPHARPLNGGFCAAQVNQVAFVTHYLIERFPSIQTVIAALEPHDFRACSKTPAQMFSPQDADDYIFRRRWLYWFYLRYFDLHSLQRNARDLRPMGELDQWGDSPLYGPGNGLYYGKFEGYDPTCFTDLRDLALSLTVTKRRLIVATTPLNPEWSALYDPQRSISRELAAGIKSAIAGTGSVFWDGDRQFETTPSDFVDAVHLRWPVAQRYSAALVASAGLDHSHHARLGEAAEAISR